MIWTDDFSTECLDIAVDIVLECGGDHIFRSISVGNNQVRLLSEHLLH